MAAPGGAESTALTRASVKYAEIERLLRVEPWSFNFFQAVRLLERMMPQRAAVGQFVHPSKEVVRFAVHTSTSFPASQIQGIEWPSHGGTPMMVVNFMGLTGPSGVLPLFYSELIRERLRAKDRAMYIFLNLFNHRMVSLFYQAWEKYRFAVARERGERDRFTHHLLDLIGLGTRGMRGRQKVADESLVFYGGLLALHTRSAAALKSIIEDYFEVPVAVEQFVGAWHALSGRDVTRFANANAFSEQLGSGAVVGDEIWDMQSGVRVKLGPLTLRQYVDFLPQGSAYEPLRAITRFFAGDEIDFEVQLVLKRDEVPGCELSSAGEAAPQLGWSTWVKTTPMGRDPGDTILKL